MTVFTFDSADRTNWRYFPENGFTREYGYVRNGLTFKDMDAKQRHLAHGLLSAGLSKQGYVKAMDVMAVEKIVRVIEDDTTGHRDSDRFHFTIFGEPSLTEMWGWRVEGHPLSLHYLLKNGELICTGPTFFGANPHEVPQWPHEGMRALADEEDRALALLKSLDPKQQKKATFNEVAPYDVLTLADKRAKLEGEPEGMRASDLNETQHSMLLAPMDEYVSNVPAEIGARRMKAARETPRDRLFFGWAGRIGRPKPRRLEVGAVTTQKRDERGNYYRAQTPTFLIEYDNARIRATSALPCGGTSREISGLTSWRSTAACMTTVSAASVRFRRTSHSGLRAPEGTARGRAEPLHRLIEAGGFFSEKSAGVLFHAST